MKSIHSIMRSLSNLVRLTGRESEILQLIAYEYTAEEIAKELYLSAHTVNTHRKKLLQKLDVRNTAGLVRKAFELGLLTVEARNIAQLQCVRALSLSRIQNYL